MAERIVIDLPLSVRSASIARAVVAAVAADAAFTIDDIEDLRLGVNEAVSVLADVEAPEARLSIELEQHGQAITVVARRVGGEHGLPLNDLDDLALRILRAVVDAFELDTSGTFTLLKRASTAADHVSD